MATKYLTKSRFKIALDCPTKLFYGAHPHIYPNKKQEDSFMMSLAQGGFQVEAYARTLYGPGIMIDERNPIRAFNHTRNVLSTGQTCFEAAFLFENLYVRCDMIRITGRHIELIEIKAKSYDGTRTPDETFLTKKNGDITSGWAPYLWDVAFQQYVIEMAMPGYIVTPYLLMADKSKTATIDGLHEKFKITQGDDHRTSIRTPDDLDKSQLGDDLLVMVNVSKMVQMIRETPENPAENQSFEDLVNRYSKAVYDREYIAPVIGKKCKGCEFHANQEDKMHDKKSGFETCWRTQLSAKDVMLPKPFDIWNYRPADDQITMGTLLAKDLEDISTEPINGSLTRKNRQQVQLEKIRDNDPEPFVLKEALRDELNSHTYPLHFIDFETSTNPLPHFADHRPYEQVAFQFSHHILHADGSIEHANEFLEANAGIFPNFEFVRQLKLALSGDNGTIFRYSHHENTVLRQISAQLENSDAPDKNELMEFIDTITQYKTENHTHQGHRNMVDLCQIIINYYYNPLTGGSNSIKAVLPASLSTSQILKNKFSKPISKNGTTSLNFPPDWVWLPAHETNPYKLLPTPFGNMSLHDLSEYFAFDEALAEGGAAATAYGKLQYTDLLPAERENLEAALLRYCELDTLAMVMIYLHLGELKI